MQQTRCGVAWEASSNSSKKGEIQNNFLASEPRKIAERVSVYILNKRMQKLEIAVKTECTIKEWSQMAGVTFTV